MKHEKEWLRTRKAWVASNPPDHAGFYVCGICGKSVHMSGMELDHIIPRSGNPASRYDFTNLQPSHYLCNRHKGSKRVQSVVSPDEYRMRKLLDL